MSNPNRMTFEEWWRKLGHYLTWSTPKVAAGITWQRAILAQQCAENVNHARLIKALQAYIDGFDHTRWADVEKALEDITGAEK